MDSSHILVQVYLCSSVQDYISLCTICILDLGLEVQLLSVYHLCFFSTVYQRYEVEQTRRLFIGTYERNIKYFLFKMHCSTKMTWHLDHKTC